MNVQTYVLQRQIIMPVLGSMDAHLKRLDCLVITAATDVISQKHKKTNVQKKAKRQPATSLVILMDVRRTIRHKNT